MEKLPVHVAVIMDGNGRWAKARGLERVYGHREGVKRAEEIIDFCRELGIKYLTLFTFSTENWQRPKEEIDFLMQLLKTYLDSKAEELLERDIRFNVIGRIYTLPDFVQDSIKNVIELTKGCSSMVLTLALSYGGRAEIVDATRKVLELALSGKLNVELTEDTFRSFLYDPELPDVDLLIRTGGEIRISNFLLWQLAYAELYFTPVLWPDFTKEEFLKALEDFAKRERKFGRIEPI